MIEHLKQSIKEFKEEMPRTYKAMKHAFIFIKIVKVAVVVGALFFQPLFAAGITVPSLGGPVIDQAGLFNSQQKLNIQNLLLKMDQQTQVQMAVLTIPSLQGEAIEQTSIRVVDQWQLGQKKTDKGLLILVARDDKRVRIEVGQGLEGSIPDAYSRRIIDRTIIPEFKKGLFYDGVMQALVQLSDLALSKEEKARMSGELQGYQSKKSDYHDRAHFWVIVFFFIMMFVINYYAQKQRWQQGAYRRRRNGFDHHDDFFSGGGFGSGSSGFGGFSGGGGGFSGGGSSGSW